MHPGKTLICSLLAALALSGPGIAAAEAYPDRPLTMVVPYTPGGSTDATGRLVAQYLSEELGQQVVVENRAGAAGNIGAAYAARAQADGYTMLLAPSGLVANVSLYKSLPYDLVKDFDPVARVALIPNALVVRPGSKADTLAQFMEQVRKANPPMTYGSAGNGTGQHLAGALFANRLGAEMTHVPYKGGAPAVTDLMGGRLDAVFAPLSEVISFIQAGKLKALAVTTRERSFALPDAPAVGEMLPGFEITLWNGILVPHGTPPDRIARLSQAMQKVLARPEVRRGMQQQGANPATDNPEQLRQLLADEVKKWAEIVKISGAEQQ